MRLAMKKNILATQLKIFMKERNISARSLSKATGIPSSTLNNLLAGRASSKPEYLLSLCEFFGCSWEMLVFGIVSKPPNLAALLGEQVFAGLVRIKIEKIYESE